VSAAAWFHAFSGVAGDMALGALLDAGADAGEVRRLLDRLPVTGWRLDVQPTQRNGIGATRAAVVLDDPTGGYQPERHLADLEEIVRAAGLPRRVEQRAVAVFTALAEAEGRVHRTAAAEVHFHEVGAVDALIDVVGTCAALEVLGVDEVHAGPVALGTGTVRAAHGVLPNPAPAVLALLAGLPTYGVDIDAELTTPTGAALLAALATRFGPMPAMRTTAIGYGAGQRELANRPNVTQVVIGHTEPAAGAAAPGQPVVLIETNVDDVTAEVLAHTVAVLLDHGAHDAWVTPMVMKKGRPAHTVHALADPAVAARLRRTMLDETGSLGVRSTMYERWPQPRADHVVDVGGQPVRVKLSADRAKVEHDDAVAAARVLGLPLREVLHRAESAARAAGVEPR
jgi:uncharacterized protein (TIGR00299 family) protein